MRRTEPLQVTCWLNPADVYCYRPEKTGAAAPGRQGQALRAKCLRAVLSASLPARTTPSEFGL
jgi:hypothetical protein